MGGLCQRGRPGSVVLLTSREGRYTAILSRSNDATRSAGDQSADTSLTTRRLCFRWRMGRVWRMRFVYLGRDLFAPCLTALLEAGHTPVAIHTTHPPGPTLSERLHQTAARSGAPVAVGPVTGEAMQGWRDPEVVICAGWASRLPDPARFGWRGINIHPSLLPEGRGPWPLPHVILKQRARTGVTIHKLVRAFDAGPILAQRAFAVPSWFDLDDLLRRTRRLAPALLLETLTDFDARWRDAQPQGEGSWWPKPTRAEQTIDWSAGSDAIYRTARAFGRDGVFAVLDEQWVRIAGRDLIDRAAPAGIITARDGDRLWVGTGDATLDCVWMGPCTPS